MLQWSYLQRTRWHLLPGLSSYKFRLKIASVDWSTPTFYSYFLVNKKRHFQVVEQSRGKSKVFDAFIQNNTWKVNWKDGTHSNTDQSRSVTTSCPGRQNNGAYPGKGIIFSANRSSFNPGHTSTSELWGFDDDPQIALNQSARSFPVRCNDRDLQERRCKSEREAIGDPLPDLCRILPRRM